MSDGTFAESEASQLIAGAAGSLEALGELLEGYRDYLLLVARQEVPHDLQAKGGASDLVQESLLDAVGGFARFQGRTPEELRGWLKRMLLNNLLSFIRRHREAGMRQVGREVAVDGSALPAPDSTPSHQAMTHERDEIVWERLRALPENYRQVLLLRYQESRSFDEIGERLGMTGNAARKLWVRAIARFRESWGNPP